LVEQVIALAILNNYRYLKDGSVASNGFLHQNSNVPEKRTGHHKEYFKDEILQ